MKSKPLRVVVLREFGWRSEGDSQGPAGANGKKAPSSGKAKAAHDGQANTNDDGTGDESTDHDVSNREKTDEEV